MDLKTAKNKVLMLIDTYSKNGTVQDPNSTKLKNYTYKMPSYFDTTQKQLATIKKIERILTVNDAPEAANGFYEVEIPNDCYQMRYVESQYVKIDWKRRGKQSIIIPTGISFPIDIFYYAYPSEINDTTSESYEFEIDIDAQEAMPFFVASQLLLSENNTIGDRLLAMYQNMLTNLDTTTPSGSDTVTNSLFTSNSNKLF